MLMMSMEVITNIMRWAAYANVCDVCVFCCCCVGAAGVPTTHILYGIPRYVDFQIIHTDSFIEFGTCLFPQIKKSSPQNKHQTWKHLEIGEHVTPENIIHWILSDQLHHLLNLFLSVTQSSQGWICWRDNHQSTWHGWRETMTKLPLPTTTEI